MKRGRGVRARVAAHPAAAAAAVPLELSAARRGAARDTAAHVLQESTRCDASLSRGGAGAPRPSSSGSSLPLSAVVGGRGEDEGRAL